jgi:glycerol-3-phosphate dehydrogenase
MPLWQAERVPAAKRSPAGTRAGSGFDRTESLARLGAEQFDLLVVGGGITGAGVALDAAARGLRTALVERDDLASGTSSRSSKMVHGGLRYLQQRDFRLVYEALHERQRLLDNAPHLVSPLPFLIPLFGRGGVVDKGVARAYSSALWMYDLTGGLRIGRRHRRIGRDEAMAHLGTLRTEQLVAGFVYYDARADDARLTLAVARTAALDHGAVVANHVEVTGLLRDARGAVVGASARSNLGTHTGTGEANSGPRGAGPEAAGAEFEIRAGVVVNATGVWADDVRALEEGAHPHSLRPAKGVHVTVSRRRLPADVAAVIPVPGDRRSIFVVPWPDGDDVYLGTTDTDWGGSLDDPACTPEDVDYLLDAANAVLTEPLRRDDVTGVWAGVRPLLVPPAGHTVSARTADMSRRHSVTVSPHGLVTVTGGKLTTYRLMAEDTVAAALGVLGTSSAAGARHCPTRRLALRGAAGLDRAREAVSQSGLEPRAGAALLARHGGETPEVLALADGSPELLEPLVGGLDQLRVEALWAAREEMALTLDDVLERRTRSALRRAEDSARAAARVGSLLAREWGRAPDQVAAEAASFAARTRATLVRAGVAGTGARR